MMKPTLLLALLALAGLQTAWAQPRPGQGPGVLTGTVVDADTGAPLTSASVALYLAADSSFVTGAVAGADGRFRFDGLAPGGYRVRASFVGYRVVRRDTVVGRGAVDLGVIALSTSGTVLAEAEVVGERPAVEQLADRTVYNVADQPITTGGSALDALQTIPSVDVGTDGQVSLRGNGNVAVHLNGRPVPITGALLASYLRQISTSQIQSIEVVPNPSARYDAEGTGGIINLVLAENTDRGWSGGLTAGGGTAPQAEAGGTLSYQRGRFDATATYGYRFYEFDSAGFSERDVGAAPGVPPFQTFAEDRDSHSHFGTVAVDYALAPRTTLLVEGVAGLRDGAQREDLQSLVARQGDVLGNRLSQRGDDERTASGTVALKRTFGPPPQGRSRQRGPRHELAVEAKAFRSDTDGDARFTGASGQGAPLDERLDEGQAVTEVYAKADYARPVGTAQVEGGARLAQRAVGGDLSYRVGGRPDPRRSNAFDYDETVAAAYLQASHGLGGFQVQAGLRAEATSRTFGLATPAAPVAGLPPLTGSPDDSYADLFPSVFVSRPFGRAGSIVRANYSRRISRPSTSQLNPFPAFEDTLTVTRGNPGLRPEYTDSFELVLRYKYALTLTPYYRRTSSPIRRLVTEAPGGVRVFGLANLDVQDAFGAELSVYERRGPVTVYAAGDLYQRQTSGTAFGGDLASDDLLFTSRGSVSVTVSEATTVQGFGYYRSPEQTETGRVSGFSVISLGLSHTFSPALSLTARVDDVFSGTEFVFESSDGAAVPLRALRDPQIRQLRFTLTYTMGESSKRRAPDVPQEESDNGFRFLTPLSRPAARPRPLVTSRP